MCYQYRRANQTLSLPSNIEHMDLTRMLMEHLSEHTQIKNIKVVRDSKGGVCAFVQCEVRGISFLIFVVKKLTYICASECNLRYSFDTDFAIQYPQTISRPQFTLRACKGIQDTTCVLSVVIFYCHHNRINLAHLVSALLLKLRAMVISTIPVICLMPRLSWSYQTL